jgi:hypothetical protein
MLQTNKPNNVTLIYFQFAVLPYLLYALLHACVFNLYAARRTVMRYMYCPLSAIKLTIVSATATILHNTEVAYQAQRQQTLLVLCNSCHEL